MQFHNGSISSLGDTIQVAANGMDSVNISLKEKESGNVGNYISGIVVNSLGVGVDGVVLISENNQQW